MPRARGSGAYTYQNPGPWGSYGREIGETLGGMYGGGVGKAIGGKLGSYAHYIGRIFGSGDYAVSPGVIDSNVLVNNEEIPAFGNDPNSVVIAHREYICDISSAPVAGQFQVLSFPINPGQVATFPWLSDVVGNTFQQYRIDGMVFEFKSTSSEYSTAVNLGYVVMATDYDSTDAVFTTKQAMENTQFGVSCKPSRCALHAIECDRKQTSVSQLYVRPGNQATGTDLRMYDHGRFSIATGGVTTTSVVLGELWCSYIITFFKSILNAPGSGILSAHYQLDPTNMSTKPLIPKPGGTAFDTIGLTFDAVAGLSFTAPWWLPVNSWWLISIWLNGTSTAAVTDFATVTTTGWTGVHTLANNSRFNNEYPQPSGIQSGLVGITMLVQVGVGNTPVALPTLALTMPTTGLSAYSSGDLIMTQVNGNYA